MLNVNIDVTGFIKINENFKTIKQYATRSETGRTGNLAFMRLSIESDWEAVGALLPLTHMFPSFL